MAQKLLGGIHPQDAVAGSIDHDAEHSETGVFTEGRDGDGIAGNAGISGITAAGGSLCYQLPEQPAERPERCCFLPVSDPDPPAILLHVYRQSQPVAESFVVGEGDIYVGAFPIVAITIGAAVAPVVLAAAFPVPALALLTVTVAVVAAADKAEELRTVGDYSYQPCQQFLRNIIEIDPQLGASHGLIASYS
jgi:hypothetical protein